MRSKNRSGAVWAAIVAGIVGVCGAAASAQVPTGDRYEGYKVIKVQVKNLRELMTLESLGAQPWRCVGVGVGASEYLVSKEVQDNLRAAGVKSDVVIDDVSRLIDAEREAIARARAQGEGGLRGPGYFSNYHTYAEISAFVDSLVAARPDLATRVTVGQSLENRTVFGVRITSPVGGASKPQIMIFSLQHAREWITGAATMYMADKLVNGYGTDQTATRLLDGFEYIFVPIANPDGYVYTWSTQRLWRKNRRNNGGSFGVDTNRNWGYQWGGEGASTLPTDETYRGTAAFSEPETQVLRDFILANPRIRFAADVHSYSQLVLSPWSYTAALPPDASVFDELNSVLEGGFEAPFGLNYVAGPTYSTIYPASGASGDWTYGAAGALGYGFELRDTGQFGFELPPDQIVPASTELWTAFSRAHNWMLDNPLFVRFKGAAPAQVQANASNTFVFEARKTIKTPAVGSARLYYRIGRSAAFTEVVPTANADGSWTASITAGPCNSVVQVYLSATSTDGQTVMYPPAGAAGAIELPAVTTSVVMNETFEAAGSWTVGGAGSGDNATSGQWVRVDPNGTAAQPEDAHGGTQCYVTGQGTVGGAVGAADVDGGQTTLTSPVFSLAGAPDARVSYWRWYSNNTGSAPAADTFVIDVSNNGGTNWTRAETVGPAGSEAVGGWRLGSWRLSALTPPVAPTANMKVRFIASDLDSGSIVEAALDDFLVERIGCPSAACPGDFNRDGAVDPSDIAVFVNQWLAELSSSSRLTDMDGDTQITPADIAAFVNGWLSSLSGC